LDAWLISSCCSSNNHPSSLPMQGVCMRFVIGLTGCKSIAERDIMYFPTDR
jgi:hypothetical protein